MVRKINKLHQYYFYQISSIMTAKTQTLLSVIISFTFYFAWTWYANSLVTSDIALLLRSALIQSSYSAFITLTFTALLSWTMAKMKCHDHPYIAIIPPLLIQSTMVYLINYLNQTPNLILTITPSIIFTAIFGIFFAHALLKKPEYQCETKTK